MHNDIKRVLFSSDSLIQRASEIGKQITEDFKGEEVIVVAVLKGSFMFLSDLLKNIDLYCRLDFVAVQSYGDMVYSGDLVLIKDISVDVRGKNVVIVEDILDTGKTLDFVKRLIEKKQPKTVKVCVLLDKKTKKASTIKADYTGFETDDVFVVGYGLDHAQLYRNLPYIGELKPEIYS